MHRPVHDSACLPTQSGCAHIGSVGGRNLAMMAGHWCRCLRMRPCRRAPVRLNNRPNVRPKVRPHKMERSRG